MTPRFACMCFASQPAPPFVLHSTPYDVAVVGNGPVGAFLALWLGRAGMTVIVAEARETPYTQPRAAHLDDEALRLLGTCSPHLLQHLLDHGRVTDGMEVVDRRGALLFHLRKTTSTNGDHGPPAALLIHQPTLEAALRREVEAIPSVTVCPGHRITALHKGDGRVYLHAQTPCGHKRLQARWVIGCDGARSTIRHVIDAGLQGGGFEQPWLVVDALMHEGDDHLPNRLRQIADPERPTTVVPFPAPRRRWEFALRPGETGTEMTHPITVQRLLRPHAETETLEIERAAVYTFHDLVAEPWRGEGPLARVLLAGDAAHQMPPFLGQGLCAGLRDAALLGWLLPLVAHGAAHPVLLNTYGAERRPHVEAVTRLAVRLGRLLHLPDPLARLRDGILHVAHGMPMLHRRLLTLTGDLPPLPRPLAHASAPHPPHVPNVAHGGSTLDASVGSTFALIGVGCEVEGWRAAHPIWSRLGVSTLVVQQEAATRLRRWSGQAGEHVVVMRPDRQAFGVFKPDDAVRAGKALAHTLRLVAT